MSDFDRRFNRMNRLVWGFIGFVFVFILSIWIGYGVVAYKTFNYVEQNGLKSVIERVWEGNKETL